MTDQDKEAFCSLMASLFSPPDEEMVRMIHQGEVAFFLEDYVQAWGGEPALLSEFAIKSSPATFLNNLKNEYRRLFSALRGGRLSLVESTFRPWTSNADFTPSFSRANRPAQGDCALHLSAIFRQLSLDIPDKYRGTPDHLVIELEFLSSLYQVATDEQIRKFIDNQMDWIPVVREEFLRFHAHPFYRNALEILFLFLRAEKRRLRNRVYASKKLN